MIEKCLRGLISPFNPAWNVRFLTSSAIQTFSVANHMTFGYIFNKFDDPIMTKLRKLNQVFAESQITNNYKISPFVETVDKTLKFGEIPFEKQSDRQFNIFEVVAYCLFKQLQGRPYFQKQVKDGSNEYFDERNYFFERFQNYITSLQIIEKQQFKMDLIANRSNFEKEYILKCEMKYAKKQIFRRFYQMCHFAPGSQLIFNFHAFSQQIFLEYQEMADELLFRIQYAQNSFQKCLKLGQIKKKQGKIHPFIINQIMALFSNDIENGYYTPLLNLQNKFKENQMFEQYFDNDKQNPISSCIHTISFIPTVMAKTLSLRYFSNMGSYAFISGERQMGKSMTLLMNMILRGYTNQSLILLIPRSDVESISHSIYLFILQNIWKQLPKKTFMQVEAISKQIYKKLQEDQNKQKKAERYKKQIIKLIGIVSQYLSGFIIDQCSTFNSQIKIKRQNQFLCPKDEEKFNFSKNIFDFVSRVGYHVVCFSSIPFQKWSIFLQLHLQQQYIHTYFISHEFQQKQAINLLIVWLNRIYETYQFVQKITFQRKQMKIQNQKLKSSQQIIEKMQYNQKDSFQQMNDKFKRAKNKINAYIQLIEKNSQYIQFYGNMAQIKKCAQQLFEFYLTNKDGELTLELLHKTNIECRVNYYSKLIIQWIDSASNMKAKKKQRETVIYLLLHKMHVNQIKYIFYLQKKFQFPKFLLNVSFKQQITSPSQEGNKLSHHVMPFSFEIWQKIKDHCQQVDLIKIVSMLYKFQSTYIQRKFTYMCKKLLQVSIRQAIFQETIGYHTPFFQTIFKLFFEEEKLSQIRMAKKINIENTAMYPLIAVQKIAEQINKQIELNKEIQNIIFVIPLNYEIPGCDRLIIRINNKINNKVKKRQASIIHIEVDANKRKEDLQEIYCKIKKYVTLNCDRSQKDDLRTYMQNKNQNQIDQQITKLQKQSKGYEKRFQQQFAKKQITLKSYEIAFVTGHKAKYLNMTAQQLKSMQIKVINFNEIVSQNQAYVNARKILSLYDQVFCQQQYGNKQKYSQHYLTTINVVKQKVGQRKHQQNQNKRIIKQFNEK